MTPLLLLTLKRNVIGIVLHFNVHWVIVHEFLLGNDCRWRNDGFLGSKWHRLFNHWRTYNGLGLDHHGLCYNGLDLRHCGHGLDLRHCGNGHDGRSWHHWHGKRNWTVINHVDVIVARQG
jgi:hypothetical protein